MAAVLARHRDTKRVLVSRLPAPDVRWPHTYIHKVHTYMRSLGKIYLGAAQCVRLCTRQRLAHSIGYPAPCLDHRDVTRSLVFPRLDTVHLVSFVVREGLALLKR